MIGEHGQNLNGSRNTARKGRVRRTEQGSDRPV